MCDKVAADPSRKNCRCPLKRQLCGNVCGKRVSHGFEAQSKEDCSCPSLNKRLQYTLELDGVTEETFVTVVANISNGFVQLHVPGFDVTKDGVGVISLTLPGTLRPSNFEHHAHLASVGGAATAVGINITTSSLEFTGSPVGGIINDGVEYISHQVVLSYYLY